MKIFGKALKEYFWPIRYHIAAAVLIVISQYVLLLPLGKEFDYLLNVSQVLWEIIVFLSLWKLANSHGFGYANLLVSGIFYCFIIHGLKVAIRFVFYGRDLAYVINRFVYGSGLVLAVTLLVIMLVFFRKKKILRF